ncbi:MAG: hypothetical protein ACKVOU_07225 [Cytophagales bacterium]
MKTFKLVSFIVTLFVFQTCKNNEPKPIIENTGPNPISLSLSLLSTDLRTSSIVPITFYYSLNTDTLKRLSGSLYLSKDLIYSIDDRVLNVRNNAGLSSNTVFSEQLEKGNNQIFYYATMPERIDSGQYYILARYRLENGDYYNTVNTPYYLVASALLSISAPVNKISISSVKVSLLSSGNSGSITFNYNSSLTEPVEVYINDLILAPDSLSSSGTVLNIDNFSIINPGQGSITKTFTLNSVSVGKYYIRYSMSYADENNVSYNFPSKSIAAMVSSELSLLTILGLQAKLSPWSNGTTVLYNYTIASEFAQNLPISLTFYLTTDSLYSSSISFSSGSGTATVNAGISVYSNSYNLYTTYDYGKYFPIIMVSKYNSFSQGQEIYFTGRPVTVLEPLTAITQLSFKTTSISSKSYSSIEYGYTAVSEAALNTYKQYNLYFSKDNIWSLDDLYINSKSVSYYLGTQIESDSFYGEGNYPVGNYYLIFRKQGSTPITIAVSSNTINITP